MFSYAKRSLEFVAGKRKHRGFSAIGLLSILMSVVFVPVPVTAAKITERSKQKIAAEAERSDLQKRVSNLKRDIDRTAAAKDSVADTLAQSEAAISDANRSLYDLAKEQAETIAKLERLTAEQSKLTKIVTTQQEQLAQLMRKQYAAGNEDRIKLLLSGDNPNRISRELQYMVYVSQAQAALIASLQTNLQAIEKNKADTQNTKEALDEIVQEQHGQKALLEKEKSKRTVLLSSLSQKLVSQRKEVGNLERDEQRLSGLVEKLAQLIEEQKKADALAQQKRLALATAEREKLAKKQAEKNTVQSGQKSTLSNAKAGAGKIRLADPIDNDEAPLQKIPDNDLENNLVAIPVVQDGHFAHLRGQLRLPVRGTITSKFGSKRGDGPSLKGLFIQANEGSEIKAVAAGRVVFADWLRGFGNLLIIDHGSQYMTVYGNNQVLLKRAGDIIKSGDAVANAGNSGGNEQSGLYFEMRHQGRAFDPLGWVTIR